MTRERPLLVGDPSGPSPPFPLRMQGRVISGFGRGSKELGIPTANLPMDAGSPPWLADARSGVYMGWASLRLAPTHPDRAASDIAAGDDARHGWRLFPMVMSIGYNPFYGNTVRSAEVHVLHTFAADFYGAPMRLLIVAFVREERDYDSLDALVEDIKFDCEVARASLARDGWVPRELGRGKLDGGWLLRPAEGEDD